MLQHSDKVFYLSRKVIIYEKVFPFDTSQECIKAPSAVSQFVTYLDYLPAVVQQQRSNVHISDAGSVPDSTTVAHSNAQSTKALDSDMSSSTNTADSLISTPKS